MDNLWKFGESSLFIIAQNSKQPFLNTFHQISVIKHRFGCARRQLEPVSGMACQHVGINIVTDSKPTGLNVAQLFASGFNVARNEFYCDLNLPIGYVIIELGSKVTIGA